ncbi:lysylphosphatidylglycerol synthase transmembrane domain-containing protein [Derxia lacustris]|uniref:lysylphosphatidylglycerol synthase transmembrane domain-containing protein n=1 Tax=Derxia lacustris TaxID=764842 RepID=UPI0015933599|nr:lysylphosphatidylglycerol synthase transmembrane domain-containing protein [Derxia lacustris]
MTSPATAQAPVRSPGRNRLALLLIAALALAGVALLLGTQSRTELDRGWQALTQLPAWLVLAVFALSLGNYLLRYLRWDAYLRSTGHVVPTGRHFLIYLSGFSLTLTPGKVGEALRSAYLARLDVPTSTSLSVFVLERLMDMVAMLALALPVLGLWKMGALSLAAIAVIGLGVIALLRQPALPLRAIGALRAQAERSGWHRALGLARLAQRLIEQTGALAGHRPLPMLALSFVAWGLEGVGLWLLAHWFAPEVAPLTVVGIYAASVIVGVVTFLPGGLGGTEVAMASLLVLAGVAPAPAAVCTLVCRAATLWFAIVLGVGAIPLLSLLGLRRPPVQPKD